MTAIVTEPFLVFYDRNGEPLENGYIYIGASGTNPEANPITVYWDKSLTTTAAQPIRTLAGYPSRWKPVQYHCKPVPLFHPD